MPVLFQTALAVFKVNERALLAATEGHTFYTTLLQAPVMATATPALADRLLQASTDRALAVSVSALDRWRVMYQTTTAAELAEWEVGGLAVGDSDSGSVSGSASVASAGSSLSLASVTSRASLTDVVPAMSTVTLAPPVAGDDADRERPPPPLPPRAPS